MRTKEGGRFLTGLFINKGLGTGADTGFHSGCCEIVKRENYTKKRKMEKMLDRARTNKNCVYCDPKPPSTNPRPFSRSKTMFI